MSKWSYTCIELVRSIIVHFTHSFENNFAVLLLSKRKSAILNIFSPSLKVKVTRVK